MDEHLLMEIVRELITAARNGRFEPDDGAHVLADSEEWSTAGGGASFGLTVEGSRFVLNVTQLTEGE